MTDRNKWLKTWQDFPKGGEYANHAAYIEELLDMLDEAVDLIKGMAESGTVSLDAQEDSFAFLAYVKEFNDGYEPPEDNGPPYLPA